MCIPWGGTRTLPQGCTVVSWLLLPCLCIPSFPWLAILWTCLLELREGHGGWIKPISCNQEMGDTKKVFVPRSPTGSCSVSTLWEVAENPDSGRIWEEVSLPVTSDWPDLEGKILQEKEEKILTATELIPKWPENLLRSIQWKSINNYYRIFLFWLIFNSSMLKKIFFFSYLHILKI